MRRQASSIKRIAVAFGVLVAQMWLTSARAQVPAVWRAPSPHEVRCATVDSSIRLEVLDWRGSGPPTGAVGARSYDWPKNATRRRATTPRISKSANAMWAIVSRSARSSTLVMTLSR